MELAQVNFGFLYCLALCGLKAAGSWKRSCSYKCIDQTLLVKAYLCAIFRVAEQEFYIAHSTRQKRPTGFCILTSLI